MRILIYDDDSIIRTLVSDYLASLGHEVHVAADEESCWGLLRSKTLQVMLIDYQLEKRTGLDIVDDIRRDPVLNKLPIILLSASEEAKAAAQQRGVRIDYFLLKPFLPAQLQRALAELPLGA